jgi:STE24 endopeptidase
MANDSPPPLMAIFIGFHLLVTLWELYLDYRQLQKNKEKDPPSEIKGLVELEKFEKSQVYQVDKRYFSIIHSLVQFPLTLFEVIYLMPLLWNYSKKIVGSDSAYEEYLCSILWQIMLNFVSEPVNIPLELYSDFVIEERHGFNKKTMGLYIKDKLKSAGISVVFIFLLVPLIIKVIRWGGEHFYLYIWVVCQILIFVFMFIYPTLIMPLFNKFEKLKDDGLRKAIEDLASGLNYPLQKLFQVDGSTRSAHSNAYMFGFWKNKRIVLFDTLLETTVNLAKEDDKQKLGFDYSIKDGMVKLTGVKTDSSTIGKWNELHKGRKDELKEGTLIVRAGEKSMEDLIPKDRKEEIGKLSDAEKVVECLKILSELDGAGKLTLILEQKPYTTDEILAILCHEIGHWFHGHVLKMLVISSIHIFVIFRLYGFVMNSSVLYEAFGYAKGERSILVGLNIFMLMFTPVETFVGFGMTVMTRMNEYQADDFAVKMKRSAELGTGLRKLCIENLGDLNPDPLFAWFHHSHPSLVERLRNMKEKDAAINKKDR